MAESGQPPDLLKHLQIAQLQVFEEVSGKQVEMTAFTADSLKVQKQKGPRIGSWSEPSRLQIISDNKVAITT